jgi:hypothetical protein
MPLFRMASFFCGMCRKADDGFYRIDSDGEKCALSKVHTITDAQNIYGFMGVSGNHASIMNVKKAPVFVTFTEDGIEEERPDFACPVEDAVFCVIRK